MISKNNSFNDLLSLCKQKGRGYAETVASIPSDMGSDIASTPTNKYSDIPAEIPQHITGFLDMTLRMISSNFGTDTRFADWLKATKDIEVIHEKRLKNAKTQGELVSRKLVKIGIIDPIEAAHIRLLTAGAKTMAIRSHAMSQAGRSVEDIEAFMIDQISSFLRPVKDKVKRALTNA